MARIFHLVLVATLSCLSLVAIGQVVCPIEGQIYYPPPMCAPCDGTCEEPNPPCTTDCKPGCACGGGRVIHNNKCIDKAQCPPECPIKGQIYYECSPCNGTCKNPNPMCPKICKPGCACPAGQVIQKKPRMCVNKTDCPRKCPIKGQIYYPGCAPCDGTCKNPNPVCTLECKPGCACPAGQVIQKKPRMCVNKTDCPQKCPIKGQIYYPGCAPCDGTCENPIVACPAVCRPGCACPKGKVIKNGKKCVKPKKC